MTKTAICRGRFIGAFFYFNSDHYYFVNIIGTSRNIDSIVVGGKLVKMVEIMADYIFKKVQNSFEG